MQYLLYIFIFYLGSLATSFYHVIGYRLPKKVSIGGRSICESCDKPLKWIDILPIIGYLLNKGRCRFCHEKISIKHFIFEVIGGLIFLLGYITYGLNISLIIYIILISVLMIESISDLYYKIVIDRVWMMGAVMMIIIRIYEANILPYLMSSALLFLLLFSISYVASKIYKKEALGGGDVKLFIFIGLILTIELGILTLFLASLFGFLYGIIKLRDNSLELPLVPFIFFASLISFLYGDAIIKAYLSLLGV
ncbi:MAG: hypothetical protein CVV61_05725 [Tenericutes bacterium HGW-Tenericutes-6]|jgi:prepilin signal peptidase PulO-like enzyme (type II secretory pathway)|nr:MAG: hypothetical protein CVV61_05725 [Tenericutes bacterium HGW-Tenericutes-6]